MFSRSFWPHACTGLANRKRGFWVEPEPPVLGPESRQFTGLNTVWLVVSLVFLGVLSAVPPQLERHKQFILLTIGLMYISESWIVKRFPKRGVPYLLLLKILLATLLMAHTGEVAINSAYYPLYYLPVISAAFYCGPWMTLLWTLFASVAYCSYLFPALREYEVTPEGFGSLALRIVCFFLVAIAVNRFLQFERSRNDAQRRT
jgi:hypothetical protein